MTKPAKTKKKSTERKNTVKNQKKSKNTTKNETKSKNTMKNETKSKKNAIALYEYSVGDLVFAKVRGFPFWPGVVAEVTKTTITTNFLDYAKTW